MSAERPSDRTTLLVPYPDQDRFFIRQRFRLVKNTYEIYLGDEGGTLIAVVDQKVMALKEDLRGVAPDGSEVFRIRARRIFDPAARYAVTDGTGSKIGELGKQFAASLLRSKWRVFSADGDELMWARERNLTVALFRRLKGLVELVPFIGWAIGWLLELLPIPYHFDFYIGDRRLGGHERVLGIRDRYRLDISGDVERSIDRRLVLALAVGMDALQAR